MPSGVFDLRGAESYSTVRRAPRSEKTPVGAVHRRPQQKAGEKCGLDTEYKPAAKRRSIQFPSGVLFLSLADLVETREVRPRTGKSSDACGPFASELVADKAGNQAADGDF